LLLRARHLPEPDFIHGSAQRVAIRAGGAEGVLCVGLGDGSALALKSEDGSSRGLLPAAGALLDLADLRASTIRNSRGEAVGEVIAES
jgi:L-asparaginase II